MYGVSCHDRLGVRVAGYPQCNTYSGLDKMFLQLVPSVTFMRKDRVASAQRALYVCSFSFTTERGVHCPWILPIKVTTLLRRYLLRTRTMHLPRSYPGDRVKVTLVGDEGWFLGERSRSNGPLELHDGQGGRLIEENDSSIKSIELVFHKQEWISREYFPLFCQSVAQGRQSGIVNVGVLQDDMALELGDAIRGGKPSIAYAILHRREIEQLSFHCLHYLLSQLATTSKMSIFSVQGVPDHHCVNLICRCLGKSAELSQFELEDCALPTSEALTTLFKCPITHFRLAVSDPDGNLDQNTATTLHLPASLETLSLRKCPPWLAEQCFLGLVRNHAIHRLHLHFSGEIPPSQQLLDALDTFLDSRREDDALIDFSWKTKCRDCSSVISKIARHDCLVSLDLEQQAINTAGAMSIASYLQSTKRLRILYLPRDRQLWDCQEEDYLVILRAVGENLTLKELSTGTKDPGLVLSTVKDSKTLLSVNMRVMRDESAVDNQCRHDLSALKYFRRLRALTVLGSQSLDAQSFRDAVAANDSLVTFKGALDEDEQIWKQLRLNQWIHQHLTRCQVMQIPAALLPLLLAKISKKSNALHAIVRGRPEIFDFSDRA